MLVQTKYCEKRNSEKIKDNQRKKEEKKCQKKI